MSKITLTDLLDVDFITEGEIRLLLDITKDQWASGKLLKQLSADPNYEDGREFYADAYKRKFKETIHLYFERIEETENVPLLNFIDVDDFQYTTMRILDNRPKKRRKNIKRLNRRLVY